MSELTERLRRAYRRSVPETVRADIRSRLSELATRARIPVSPDPTVHGLRDRLRSLHGRYEGQRCFIMGNGPSLNDMDLERFAGEHVWGLNRCHLIFDRISWRPDFYVAIDERVVPDTADEIARLQAELALTIFFFPAHFRFDGILRSTPNTYWYRQVMPHERSLPWSAFSDNPSRNVRNAGTVTIAAMQLAVHLGFSPIYLIGCDTSYSVQGTVIREDEHGGLLSTRDDDRNHFDPRYFGAGRRWHVPDVQRMVRHYEHARAACDRLGVEIFNATVGGQLEVFPRIDYRQVV